VLLPRAATQKKKKKKKLCVNGRYSGCMCASEAKKRESNIEYSTAVVSEALF